MGWASTGGRALVAGVAGIVCGAAVAFALGPKDVSRGAGAEASVPEASRATPPEARREPATRELPSDPAEEARLAEVRARAMGVAAAVTAVEGAHERLHEPKEVAAVEGRLAEALKATFGRDGERRKLVKRLYDAVGAGRFVRGGRLTGLGAAVVARVGDLARHGVDAADYTREELAAIAARRGVEELDPSLVDSGAKRVLRELLEDAGFDPLRATRRLESLEEIPTADDVVAVADDLVRRGIVGATGPDDVADDVRLAATLVQLALDFRFVKRVGPFDLRKAESVFTRPRDADRLLKLLVAIVEGDPVAPDGVAADGSDRLGRLDPPHPQYAKMVAIHARYLGYAAAGGCKSLPTGWRLRPGAKGEEVKRLQQRLACEGYYDGEIDGVYEGAALEAGRTYQRHHDLAAEGIIGEDTLKSLNTTMERRAWQIALALQRMRESKIDEMGETFIRVNIPSFELAVYERGEVIRRHRVIVGTNRLDDDKKGLVQGHLNRTKLFTTNLYEIIVNPTWILPERVEHGLLKGKIAKDPDYLAKNNIRVVRLKSGREVYVQGLGDDNVLGKVKFLLKESNAIYLHDTDKRHLFRERQRDFSHGCVRVDGAIEFAKWLLERDGFSTDEIDRAFRLTSVQRGFKMNKPVDLITEYMTVDISDEGLPVFYGDVYGYDRAFEQGNIPPRVSTRWGAVQLRPRWVPQVSKETVDKWRAAGQHAPRDYDPKVHGK